MSYNVLLSEDAEAYYRAFDEKSQRIVKGNLQKLADDPYPGGGKGDKERLVVDGEETCRLHIGRTHTAFYDILEDDGEVRVVELLDIDDAHKRYGW
jgi:mRNA-degrading endonuclease RelE of RelBE toxin-antitoxin system